MLSLSSLSPGELRRRFDGPGLVLRTGPFRSRIRTDIPALVDTISLLYADYPVDEEGFADFQLHFASTPGWRRWLRPQVRFDQDGLRPFKPLPLSQAHPMFEWVMNWCVSNKAHSYLVIHAAVLERNGRAFILPAPPGSGKSTLCAALVCRGWRLLSDELTLVRPHDLALVPLPRPVSLKNASIGVIQAWDPQAVFGPAVPETSKGTIAHMRAPRASVAAAETTAQASHIVFPRYEAGAPVRIEGVAKARLFTRVADNAFNYTVLGATGFDALARLVDACAGFDFCYSELDEAIALFERLAGES
ncbi:HprK-related kinase A [Massilia sp. IC2-476]|uniref:HprK-related kinase A n=1 Tax=Massilia sp. IC2-476 TaxID=2887199 RepID=UPI001D11605C|nr:HprK-related kinase A [Massilia sp. IC2-476]MCC2973064.1 HprK-related kinase A [Massilia sp. IC2-476]